MEMKLGVALLIVIFGWSSWIDVNGLWVELPLMVNKLPEGWNLPAYFTVIIQLANIGPLLYGVVKYMCNKRRTGNDSSDKINLETGAIFAIIVVGILATVLLSFFWKHTSFIDGVEHSTALLTLAFFLSLVDCTSSVTFLPFLARFSASYMTAFYIGEGMSGLLPTAISFAQGAGEYTCVNTSTNGTFSIQPEYKPLLFPVRDFFIALSVMLLLSLIAFSVIRYSSYCKNEYTNLYKWEKGHNDSSTSTSVGSDSEQFNNQAYLNSQPDTTPATPMLHGDQSNSLTLRQYLSLLGVNAFCCALANGALPSIQIYSLLPYGQIYYSVGVKLATLANPLACFLGFCAFPQSFIAVGVLTAITTITSIYIIVVASYSPVPPVEGVAAAVLMVLMWVLFTAAVSYLKVYIASIMLKKGHTALFWLGVVTQVGSFVGAIISFICTTVLQLFQSAPQC